MADSRSDERSKDRATLTHARSPAGRHQFESERIDTRHDFESVMERFQALRGGEKLTKEDILQELLPNQKCVLLAAPLVEYGGKTSAMQRISHSSSPRLVTRQSRNSKSRQTKPRYPHLNPLSAGGDSRLSSIQSQITQHRDYTMVLWEDKLARHKLSLGDALYLLVHEETMNIIECTLFLKASGMTMAQMMEVEMTLDQLGREWLRSLDAGAAFEARCSSHYSTRTACQILSHNVWKFGVAFHTNNTLAPVPKTTTIAPLSPLRSPLPNKTASPISILNGSCPPSVQPFPLRKSTPPAFPSQCVHPTNQYERDRIWNDLQSSRKLLQRHGDKVIRSSEWIQAHCVDEIRTRNSHLFRAALKNQAVVMLASILKKRFASIKAKRFQAWHFHVQEDRCLDMVERFCRLKGATKVLSIARRHFRYRLFSCWERWKRLQRTQRKLERLAATVTIQSWMRCILAKQRSKTYHVERAATLLQSVWRGHFCRKLLTRRRRYAAYTASARVVQRAFRCYHNRCQFAIYWRREKASCCITRNVRKYCARRRLCKSWGQRVARFHSAAVIQLWMREKLHRIRVDRAIKAQHMSSAFTLQRFFRYARFVLCFSSRVQCVAQRRHAAAVTLQNAYRAKLARARFHALKDQLEAQRRQEILKMMWDNAYATTIQRSWRKKRLWRQQRPVVVEAKAAM